MQFTIRGILCFVDRIICIVLMTLLMSTFYYIIDYYDWYNLDIIYSIAVYDYNDIIY